MLENKKYRLTGTSKMIEGTEVFQIEALVDFGDVQVGDLGGYIEKEENLSFEADDYTGEEERDISWVYDDAVVYGESGVAYNSQVRDSAVVKDSVVVSRSTVTGDSNLFNCSVYKTNAHSTRVDDCKLIRTEVEHSDLYYATFDHTEVSDSKVRRSFLREARSVNSEITESAISKEEVRDVKVEGFKTYQEEGTVYDYLERQNPQLTDDDVADLNGLESEQGLSQ